MQAEDRSRLAIAAAQTILKEHDSSMVPDGKAGKFTLATYNAAPAALRSAVDSIMTSLGQKGSIPAANLAYNKTVGAAKRAPGSESAQKAVFDLQVVPAIVRLARARGLNPWNHIAQLALETGYGAKTPLQADGKPSYNYGGIKQDAARTTKYADAMTTEVIKGQQVRRVERFAAFDSADEFARAYFDYLFNGPSSYRYKGLDKATDPLKFGEILRKGGYATDPAYATKFASIADSVSKRYALA